MTPSLYLWFQIQYWYTFDHRYLSISYKLVLPELWENNNIIDVGIVNMRKLTKQRGKCFPNDNDINTGQHISKSVSLLPPFRYNQLPLKSPLKFFHTIGVCRALGGISKSTRMLSNIPCLSTSTSEPSIDASSVALSKEILFSSHTIYRSCFHWRRWSFLFLQCLLLIWVGIPHSLLKIFQFKPF